MNVLLVDTLPGWNKSVTQLCTTLEVTHAAAGGREKTLSHECFVLTIANVCSRGVRSTRTQNSVQPSKSVHLKPPYSLLLVTLLSQKIPKKPTKAIITVTMCTVTMRHPCKAVWCGWTLMTWWQGECEQTDTKFLLWDPALKLTFYPCLVVQQCYQQDVVATHLQAVCNHN